MAYMRSKVLFEPGFVMAHCGRESDLHRNFVSGVHHYKFLCTDLSNGL